LNGVMKRSAVVRIATWNVRSLCDFVKTENAIMEMDRLRIQCMGVSEMRWTGRGKYSMARHKIYYSGNDEPMHWRGVGFIVTNQTDTAVRNFVPQSDRIAILQLYAKDVNINFIQVYAPTAGSSEDEIETFYADLKAVMRFTRREEVTIVMGDFNAKVGAGIVSEVTGQWGLGTRNERGERLVQFCQEEELIIANTYFKLPARRLYTWRSPRDNPGCACRNQIDYIMVNRRFRNAVKAVKTMPGADIGSDHCLLVSEMQIRLKKIPKKVKKVSIDPRKAKEVGIRDEVIKDLNNGFDAMMEGDVEMLWSQIRKVITDTAEKHLKADKKQHKEWMTNEILELIEERRKWQNKDRLKYKEVHRRIQAEVRLAKSRAEEERCKELETLHDQHDIFNLHKKIRESTNKNRGRQSTILVDKNDNPINNIEMKKQVWEEYIEKLFQDVRAEEHNAMDSTSGPEIVESEVMYAVRQLRNGKAPGPDNICGELLKLIEGKGITMLTKLFNKVYLSGNLPIEWRKSFFIALPKKANARRCPDHRTISLMNHVLKAYLKVILRRIYRQCDQHISVEQFGFRNGFGTRDALFGIQVLIQRCLDVDRDVYLCFIDYEKAFDRVRHSKLIEILKGVGVDERNVRSIANVYWTQVASVLLEGEETREVRIRRGVRQGCVLSPTLFNLYSEKIMEEALEGATEGILINGRLINNVRYADDTVLVASTVEELQAMLDRVNTASEKFGININIKKTKLMVVTKKENIPASLTLDGEDIERCARCKYLGCVVNERWDMTQEIGSRIEQARTVFVKMQRTLTSRNINVDLRLRMVRCYIFPIVLYGMEGWTLTQKLMDKINAFEMWVYRRMLRISWRDRITNREVLSRLGSETQLLLSIKKRKLQYFGHIMRGDKYQFLQLIIQGKIEGKRAPGRRRTSWLKNLRQWFGRSTSSLFRAAVSKVQIAMMIANLR